MVFPQSRVARGAVALCCAAAVGTGSLFCALPALSVAPSAFASSYQAKSSSAIIAFDQALIDQVGVQKQSRSCLGYAAAYAETITSGRVHTWAEYDYNGGAMGEGGFYGRNMTAEFECLSLYDEDSVLRTLYDSVNEGRPVVLFVSTGSGGMHWVTVVGYENVSDPNNLSLGNFLMLDPDWASGTEPESLANRGTTLRFGDAMGNVRISRASAAVNDGRVPSEHFSDCYLDDWFVDGGYIDYVFDHGIMTGLANTTRFDPSGVLTRGQAVTILYRIAGSPEVFADAQEFSDVDYASYYGDAVRWARAAGVVRGTGGNLFSPDAFVTREELAVMVENYARTIAHLDTASDGAALFALADSQSVSAWAQPSLSWCVDAGIITGQVEDAGTFARPQGNATRAQMAKIATVLSRDVLGQGRD